MRMALLGMNLPYRLFLFICLSLIISCAGSDPNPTETLTIFAAASLTDAFTAVAEVYEMVHPETDIVLNFAGSQTLRLQIEQGAQADIFASANQLHMDYLRQANLVEPPIIFTQNQLIVITPAANPAQLEIIADLAKPDLKLVLAGANVPVGRYAREMLLALDGELGLETNFSEQVLANLVSEEDNVKGVLAKVRPG